MLPTQSCCATVGTPISFFTASVSGFLVMDRSPSLGCRALPHPAMWHLSSAGVGRPLRWGVGPWFSGSQCPRLVCHRHLRWKPSNRTLAPSSPPGIFASCQKQPPLISMYAPCQSGRWQTGLSACISSPTPVPGPAPSLGLRAASEKGLYPPALSPSLGEAKDPPPAPPGPP